jgi:hypothetical protein
MARAIIAAMKTLSPARANLAASAIAAAALLVYGLVAWFPATPAKAGDITYPNLTGASNILDTDLLATWRASGPLTKVQASVLAAYLQAKLGTGYLQPANNLSDLSSITAARANLGLNSAALATIGTSGAVVPQLNTNNTWSGTNAFDAAVTVGSTLNVTGTATFSGTTFFSGSPNFFAVQYPTGPVYQLDSNVYIGYNLSTSELNLYNGSGNAYLDSSGNLHVSSAFIGPLTGNVTGNVSGNAATASNASALGGVAASGYVQNNGGTYGINISGNANTATNATNAGNANAVGNLRITAGNVYVGAGSTVYVSYGITYNENIAPICGVQIGSGTPTGVYAPYVTTYSGSGFNVHNSSGQGEVVTWIAAGN